MRLLIHKLACSLVGQEQQVEILPGSLTEEIYGARGWVTEQFQCNYGLNPVYQERLFSGELELCGVDTAGEARLVALREHRFYVASLFLPQMRSQPAKPHPLITAFVAAAALEAG